MKPNNLPDGYTCGHCRTRAAHVSRRAGAETEGQETQQKEAEAMTLDTIARLAQTVAALATTAACLKFLLS